MGAYTIAAASSFNGFAPVRKSLISFFFCANSDFFFSQPQSSYIMSWEDESEEAPKK